VLIDASRPDARRPEAEPLAVISRPLGRQTNNVAEYSGVLLALRLAQRLGATEVDLILDSNLVVEQLHGRWKVRDAKLRPLAADALRLLSGFHRWSAVHEPRERNVAADALCNLALDDPAAAAEAERRFSHPTAGLDLPGQRGLFDGDA
jgi:probable phosphoglycerate mutase